MNKIIVAGGRDFNNYELLKSSLDNIINEEYVTIVSGCALGADRFGIIYAKQKGYGIDLYPADWDKYGKSAGYVRNALMADNADTCICFWDGKSKGTKHMIDIATEKGLKVEVIRYEK